MPSQYKTYTRSSSKLPYRVKTWINRRCEICKKFIGGTKQFLCGKCYNKKHTIQIENNHLELRNQVEYYGLQSIRNFIEISIPTLLKNNLRIYL